MNRVLCSASLGQGSIVRPLSLSWSGSVYTKDDPVYYRRDIVGYAVFERGFYVADVQADAFAVICRVIMQRFAVKISKTLVGTCLLPRCDKVP